MTVFSAVWTPAIDVAASHRTTRRMMAVSALVHALLILLIVFGKPAPGLPPLVEISILEPGDGGEPEAAPAPPARSPVTQAGQVVAGRTDMSFRREAATGDMAPDPQAESALQDEISARLASMRNTSGPNLPVAVASAGPPRAWGAPGGIPGATGGGGNGTLALTRGGHGGSGGPPLALSRGAPIPAPVAAVPSAPVARAEHARPAAPSESGARRQLAGAILMGPIADRPVLHHVTPAYPDWAKRDGVEGSVTLYFLVRPDGSVKENVLVQKTAGFGEFDDNARAALREWRFAALPPGRAGEQWGTITFRFRLRDAG